MSSIKLACVVPNLAKVSDIDFIVNVANKVNGNFGAAHRIGIKFCRYLGVYESLL